MDKTTRWKLLTSTALARCWLTVPGLLFACTDLSRLQKLVDEIRPGYIEAMKVGKS